MVIGHTEPDFYNVAVKAFVRKGDRVLIMRTAVDKMGDLPGGRIGVGEFDISLEEVLRREIEEELGSEVRYRIIGPAALFRHRRPEIMEKNLPERRILMIGFELEYESGDIKLSDEHDEYRWMSLDEAETALPGGQQDGIRKYREYLRTGKITY